MLSLDFKLTSGQVRALLRIWHGRTFAREQQSPALSMLSGSPDSFVTAGKALIRKGLVTHKVHYRPDGLVDDRRDAWCCTPQGDAIAQMIVQQAALVMAVDASRREQRTMYAATTPDAQGGA